MVTFTNMHMVNGDGWWDEAGGWGGIEEVEVEVDRGGGGGGG